MCKWLKSKLNKEEREFQVWYKQHREYRIRVRNLIHLTNEARKNGATK
jgi:hypothetical protein